MVRGDVQRPRDCPARFVWVLGGGMLLAVVLGSIAVAQEPASRRQSFREIYQELVEINTTNSVGDSLRAAVAMAARLKAGGLTRDNVQVLSSAPRKGNRRVDRRYS
jgi:hypothetical protein